jgi:hypothetical protein
VALLQNISLYACNPVRLMSGSIYSDNRSNWNRGDTAWNRCHGEGGMGQKYGMPFGYLPPFSWHFSRSSGGIASRRFIAGTGRSENPNLAAGMYISANALAEAILSGSADLLAGMISDLMSKGNFLTKPVLAGSIPASATILCSGEVISAAVLVLGPLEATLAGVGTVPYASLNALVGIYAMIPSGSSETANLAGGIYGAAGAQGLAALVSDLLAKGVVRSTMVIGEPPTAFDIAQSILNAQTSDYSLEGTIGRAIGTTGSGGIDPDLASMIEELHEEAFGRWVLDPVADTLTLFKSNGDALKEFSLTRASGEVPAYVERAS